MELDIQLLQQREQAILVKDITRGRLLQYRKTDDDRLHLGILFSKEHNSLLVLSVDGSIHNVSKKQVHPLLASDYFEAESEIYGLVQRVLQDFGLEPVSYNATDSKEADLWKVLKELLETSDIFKKHFAFKMKALVESRLTSSFRQRQKWLSQSSDLHVSSDDVAQPSIQQELMIRAGSGQSLERILDSLKKYAQRLVDRKIAEDALACEVLVNLGFSPSPLSSFKLLVQLGYYTFHENLFLKSSRFGEGFHENLLIESDEILSYWNNNCQDTNGRVDLTHLLSFSIDSPDTIEVDDAISLDSCDSDYVWVHISNVSHFIPFESPLVQEAIRRSSSLYLPTRTIGMFPMHLSELLLSVGSQYGKNYALSFGFRISSDGSLDDIRLENSIIRPPLRISYQTANDIIEEADDCDTATEKTVALQRLLLLAKRRRSYRSQNGAVDFNVNDSQLKVTKNDRGALLFEFLSHSTTASASNMVKELMLAAGEAAAIYGKQRNWILPFRGQPKVKLPDPTELYSIPEGVARIDRLLQCMTPSFISYKQAFHSSLGLSCYVQVTSPIRRATDLLAHYQIKNYTENKTTLITVEKFESYVKILKEGTREGKYVEGRTIKYWCLEYLKQQDPDVVYDAVVVRRLKADDPTLLLVQLDPIPQQFVLKCSNRYLPGDKIQVKIDHVEPRTGSIQFIILNEKKAS